MKTRVITMRVTEAEYQEIIARGRVSDVLRDAMEAVGVYPGVIYRAEGPPDGRLVTLACNTPR